jgi:hypothetical protein
MAVILKDLCFRAFSPCFQQVAKAACMIFILKGLQFTAVVLRALCFQWVANRLTDKPPMLEGGQLGLGSQVTEIAKHDTQC